MTKIKYVLRYDNGSGYMEYAGSPVDSLAKARAMNPNLEWSSPLDIIECTHNGKQWIDGDVVETVRDDSNY